MRFRSVKLIGLLSAVSALPLLSAASEQGDTGTPGLDSAPESREPYYEQIIKSLKEHDSVIPKVPPVNPVVATYSREAIIPPMCYTDTAGQFNPCYVCHQDAIEGRENVMNDADLQIAYSFSDEGMTNHWKNLFEDRSDRVAAISDEAILDWINTDNYTELKPRLEEAGFSGWIPDLEDLEKGAEAFDEQGFAKDGSLWVAFNYKPLPSTFWPTNGSTDDVMIRLDALYRTNADGEYSKDIYLANLSILEANFKGKSEISTPPIDEKAVGKDLNGDGALGIINRITDLSQWVGAAKDHFIDTHLYPAGTEFLHTVRYVNVDDDGFDGVSTRMKEVRYMKKWRAYAKGTLARHYQLEEFEKELGNLPGYAFLGQYGLDNGNGWAIQSFLEGKNGRLRAATYEENLFCMGCHNSVGATIDKTFSFARKVDGAEGWGYINLEGMPDAPNMGELKGEILTYLQRVGGGGEFRSNPEMVERWFNADGTVNTDTLAAADLAPLIPPHT